MQISPLTFKSMTGKQIRLEILPVEDGVLTAAPAEISHQILSSCDDVIGVIISSSSNIKTRPRLNVSNAEVVRSYGT